MTYKYLFCAEHTSYVENPAFEPIPLTDLLDPSMSYWVHHSQYILNQGRTTWWSAKKAIKDEVSKLQDFYINKIIPSFII